jgi:DNA-binding NarL/FixJ family response regulator
MSILQNDEHRTGEPGKLSLTKREIEIVTLICGEYSNKQIACKLALSQHTVETYKKSIRKKTGAYTAVGVAMAAIRHKIIIPALAWLSPSIMTMICFDDCSLLIYF